MSKIKMPPRDWLTTLGIVIALYLFLTYGLSKIITGMAASYVIRPAAWALLAYYIFRLPKYKPVLKPRQRKLLIKIAVCVAVCQVYLSLVAGFFGQFGKSPYSFTITGIFLNLIFVGSSILGTEFSRAWLINRLAKNQSNALTVFIALFFTFIFLSPNKIPRLDSTLEGATRFLGSDFIPLFMENLTASYFALWGGVVPAILYRGVLQAYHWFCPVLPDLNWAMKAFTGTVVPVMAIVISQHILKLNPGKGKGETSEGLVNLTICSIIMVILIWFSAGVFPVKPTVIISGSMRPTIEVGDVAIVAEQNSHLLKVGDIIQFGTVERSIPTVHRIIKQYEENGKPFIVTQGDANDISDEPINPKQVMGKVIFVIPKAGLFTLAVRDLFS